MQRYENYFNPASFHSKICKIISIIKIKFITPDGRVDGSVMGGMAGEMKGEIKIAEPLYLKTFPLSDGRDGHFLNNAALI